MFFAIISTLHYYFIQKHLSVVFAGKPPPGVSLEGHRGSQDKLVYLSHKVTTAMLLYHHGSPGLLEGCSRHGLPVGTAEIREGQSITEHCRETTAQRQTSEHCTESDQSLITTERQTSEHCTDTDQ